MKRIKRIDAIKYYGMIGMCLLHGSFLIKNVDTKISLYTLTECVGQICLPLYFFLSSFFFTYKYDPSKLDSKVISRVKSLLIPFFFWNLFCIVMYYVLNLMQKYMGVILTHETYFPRGYRQIMEFVILRYRNPPTWYLLVLMEFVLITPVLIALVKKYKRASLVSLFSLLVINIVFMGDIEYASVLYWMPAYGSGIWCSVYYPEIVLEEKENRYSLFSFVFFIFWVLVRYYLLTIGNQYAEYYMYCGWMIMPIILLDMSNILPQGEIYVGMYDAEFLIFCLHYPVIQWLDAFADNFFVPSSDVEMICKWIGIVLVTLVVIHVLHYVIKRGVKPLYFFLYGKY